MSARTRLARALWRLATRLEPESVAWRLSRDGVVSASALVEPYALERLCESLAKVAVFDGRDAFQATLTVQRFTEPQSCIRIQMSGSYDLGSEHGATTCAEAAS